MKPMRYEEILKDVKRAVGAIQSLMIGNDREYDSTTALNACESAYAKISKIGEQESWSSVADGLPQDDEQDYLVYSTVTQVYEKVNLTKIVQMVNNPAKITHWRVCPDVPVAEEGRTLEQESQATQDGDSDGFDGEQLKFVVKERKGASFRLIESLTESEYRLHYSDMPDDLFVGCMVVAKVKVQGKLITDIKPLQIVVGDSTKERVEVCREEYQVGDLIDGVPIMSFGKVYAKQGKKMCFAYFR